MTPLPSPLMVIAPHPDDEVIGAGGTIHRALREGGQVFVLIAHGIPERVAETVYACERLGGAVPYVLYSDGNWLDGQPIAPIVSQIEAYVSQLRPQVVLLPDPASAHQEHRVVFEAAMAAMRPSGGTGRHRPPVVASYEEPADVWGVKDPRRPTWTVVLDETDVKAKTEAMDLDYTSQARPWPSERSAGALMSLAHLRGSQAGFGAAEVFTVLRMVS